MSLITSYESDNYFEYYSSPYLPIFSPPPVTYFWLVPFSPHSQYWEGDS